MKAREGSRAMFFDGLEHDTSGAEIVGPLL